MNVSFRASFPTFLPVAVLFSFCLCSSVGAETILSWNQVRQQEPEWYGSAEAVRIADNVLVYQHETGGWPKNTNMALVLTDAEKVRIREQQADRGTTLGQPTIDNGATHTEMRYLAQVATATGQARFATGFLRGLDYLLDAQYDNGGWAQYYPVRRGYYQRITFNDGAMIGVMRMLRDVADGKEPYQFVDNERLARVAVSLEKGLEMILKAQIEVDGRRTAWCAQHDEHDLSPAAGRSYEHPSISGSESVEIIRYLMTIEDPGPDVIAAIQAAVAWFDEVQIRNTRMIETQTDGQRDRVVETNPAYGSVWARFYELETNRPIFSGRDGVIKYEMAEIERERRVGYRWLGDWGRRLLETDYPAWKEKWITD